jgi:hypothetical protein
MDTLDQLEIVGYADVLGPESVPHIVAPIFRFRDDPDTFLFPPFRLVGNEIVGATRGSRLDMVSFVATGQATGIDPAIIPLPEHELWIAQDMRARYEPAVQAEENLRKIAFDAIEGARLALAGGDLVEAERLCSTAVAADDRLPEPLPIKGAIYALRREPERVKAMRIMAGLHCTPQGFDMQVNAILQALGHGQAQDRPSAAAGRCSGLATVPPVACRLERATAA